MTGLSISTSCVSRAKLPSTSKSASSASPLEARTRFVRLGTEDGRDGWMEATRLRASSRVRTRGESGKLPRIWMSLSVRSIASCGCLEGRAGFCRSAAQQKLEVKVGGLMDLVRTPATPRFSMVGILCPNCRQRQKI